MRCCALCRYCWPHVSPPEKKVLPGHASMVQAKEELQAGRWCTQGMRHDDCFPITPANPFSCTNHLRVESTTRSWSLSRCTLYPLFPPLIHIHHTFNPALNSYALALPNQACNTSPLAAAGFRGDRLGMSTCQRHPPPPHSTHLLLPLEEEEL